jgi:hydroxyjasmonate sulfotransferase
MEQTRDERTESEILLLADDPLANNIISSESHSNSDPKPTTRGGLPLILYKNYWFVPHHAANIMMLHRDDGNFVKARHGDTILASNPKCGTTWLKALAFTITTRSRYSFVEHPLLSRHPQELIPYIEIPFILTAANDNDDDDTSTVVVASDSSPARSRLLATHMPFSLLPESIAACRIVYICREPKDAFVSGWHFANRMRLAGSMDLDTAFNLFCEGFWPMGPFWDHCLEYWKESIARPDTLLFLKYEEMMLDPVKAVRKLATFLGAPFTDEEESNGVPAEVVRLCSFETLSGANNGGTEQGFVDGPLVIEKSAFFRRGKVGDWANHMSEEMGRKLDMVVQEKLKGSGLVF